jgi:hypothetical protein
MIPIDHDCTPQERNVLLDRIAALEAHAADCKRLVTACEDDIDAERMKRREVEAALQHEQEYSKEAAGASMRYCQRAESAEADLADCAKTCGGLEYRLEQAEAALAEAITYTIKYGPYQGSSRETVWADLRARAEEGSE